MNHGRQNDDDYDLPADSYAACIGIYTSWLDAAWLPDGHPWI